MNDSEKMFVTKENEPEIRRIVKKEISDLIVKYFIAGFALGLLVAYLIIIIEGM